MFPLWFGYFSVDVSVLYTMDYVSRLFCFFFFMAVVYCCGIMLMISWNTRGLGIMSKRKAVHDLVNLSCVNLVTMHECKIYSRNHGFLGSLGFPSIKNWCYLNSIGTSSVIIVEFNPSLFSFVNSAVGFFS